MSNASNQVVAQSDMGLNNFIDDVAISLEINKKDLNEGFELGKSQNWDSMGLVSVMNLIDRHFQVFLDFSAVHSCKTFGDLLKLIKK